MNTNLIAHAVSLVGAPAIARAMGVTTPAVYKFRDRGFFPRSELTGETDYCAAVERVTDGRVSAKSLRDQTRSAWLSRSAA